MSVISDSLDLLATAIEDNIATVSPEGVWVWETGFNSISLSTLPVVVVAHAVGEWHELAYHRTFKAKENRFEADVLVYLNEGFFQYAAGERASTVAPLAHAWHKPMHDVLRANRDLGGGAALTGYDEGVMARYLVDNLRWGNDVYWGIWYKVPMKVEYT